MMPWNWVNCSKHFKTVVVASSKFGLFFLDIFTFEDETPTWARDVGNCLPNLTANSHIACRAHAIRLPCRSLIHTCHAVSLPRSDSTVSFVKVRVVAGSIRTASPTV